MMLYRTGTVFIIVVTIILHQRCGGVQEEEASQTSQGHDAMEVSPSASQEREDTPAMEMYSSAVYALERKYPNPNQVRVPFHIHIHSFHVLIYLVLGEWNKRGDIFTSYLLVE